MACRAQPGPEPREPVPTSTPPAAATVSIPAVAPEPPAAAPAPVRWVLLPKASHWAPVFQRKTDAGLLYAGPGKERWLLREGVPPRGAGPDPVALAGVLPNGVGYTFITPAGEVYEANAPLADLSLALAPSKPFVAAASGRDHFLAIDDAGALQRSADRGRTWQGATLLREVGRFTDVAMLETGAGLLLANHSGRSELFSTWDDGVSWRKVEGRGYTFIDLVSYRERLQPVMGANRQHDLYEYAVLDDTLSKVTGEGRVSRSAAPFPYPAALPPDLATFVNARLEAPVRWVALRETSSQPSVWELSVVPFGELPSYRAVEALAGCALSVAATTSVLGFACRRSSPRKDVLFLSHDAGQSFRELPLPANPVALYALGDAFVVQTPCDGPRETRGPYLLAPPAWQARRVSDTTCRTHLAFANAAEPGSFLSVAWADSELTLQRWPAGDPKPSLVSIVGGAPHLPVQQVTVSRDGSTVVVAVPTAHPWPPVTEATDTAAVPTPVLFRSIDGGRHFGEVALPTALRAIALTGSRGFGVDHDDGAWATNDLGASWQRVASPIGAGTRPIECNEAGCITVRGLRVGWER